MSERTVWKYPLPIEDRVTISTPALKPLLVGADPSGQKCVWFEIAPELPAVDFVLAIVGTGNPVPDGFEHLDSFVQGPFVWHVYVEAKYVADSSEVVRRLEVLEEDRRVNIEYGSA